MNMREEFEAAYCVKHECLTSLVAGLRRGNYYSYIGGEGTSLNAAWWAWQASRAALVIMLPEPSTPETFGVTQADDPEQYKALEARHGAQSAAISQCRRAIEAAGLKVKA